MKSIAAIVALALFTPLVAQAEPMARFGETVYPARAVPAPAPAVAQAPPAAETAPSRVLSRRERRAEVRAARRAALLAAKTVATAPQLAANTPVERPPAPTPADSKAQTSIVPASGPHEEAAPTLKDLVTRHARENGVPEKLASAVVTIESRFNPRAHGGRALGLMQIQYATARAAGFSGEARGLFEPDTNLRYGMKVLSDAYKASHGDVCLTLAKYQSGHLTTHVSAGNRAYCNRARALMAKA